MQIRPISLVQSMSGKVCMHSDMYVRTNRQTQKVTSGKICFPSDKAPSAKQLKAKARFTIISQAVKAELQDEQKKAEYVAAFRSQSKYGSVRGMVFAKLSPLYDEDGQLIQG